MTKENKLTIKQEKFCQVYIETGNASEAYRRAYDAENMKERTLNTKASELLKNGKIAVRLEELQKAAQERHEVTVESITKELDHARDLALSLGQTAAAVNAINSKAKMHGLVVDRSDRTNINMNYTLSDEPKTEDDWEEEYTLGSATGSSKSTH